GAQSNNQNTKNNADSDNQQQNNINNPYTTVPQDSVNRNFSNDRNIRNSQPPNGALQQRQHILNQSGQNQVIIPPNAAGPDTNLHRITRDGNFNNNASDTTIRKNYKRKNNNTTLTDSPGTTLPGEQDTTK
ncbi:MAG TPA: hypothetical protein VJY62_18855, partial [Bacteroidia bacterium]|nr:hypothetical protein [Bacteroidia bacterium]